MRKLVLSLLFAAIPAAVFADVELTREEATGTIKAYHFTDLERAGLTESGKLVKLRIGRIDQAEKQQDGSIHARYYRTYFYIPAEGADWFLKAISKPGNATTIAYARMARGTAFDRIQLLGREIKTDSKGSRIIW